MPPLLRNKWLPILLAFFVPLAFALFTNHAWEDYFITLRSSRNLVEGHGLVFNPGERVHTFTSPLGVLLPALCTFVAGVGHEQAALWLFRLINASALAATAALLWKRLQSLRLGEVGMLTVFGFILFDGKLTDFSINGMETALLVYFALLLWSELEAPGKPRPWIVAIACAGLQWTRPDAFILAIALVAPHCLFRQRADGGRRIPASPLLRGILLGGLLYLPWFAWAWWYYGTPVPHTIIAKSQFTPPVHLRELLVIPWRTLTGNSLQRDVFLPAYWYHGGWPVQLSWLAYALSIVSAFAWVFPWLSAPARRVSLSVFLGMFYVCAIILFPWYSPPWFVLAALSIGFVFDHLAGLAARGRNPWLGSAVRVVVGVCICAQIAVLCATAREMRVQQRIIEDNGRREIGKWLHQNAAATDTVFLEPLGYIGYYSQLKTYDFPGLSSPEVVAAVRNGSRRFTEVVARLHPTWLVLRPFEIADANLPENAVLREYELIRTWNAKPQLDTVQLLPGRNWVEHDAEFRLFRRKSGTIP